MTLLFPCKYAHTLIRSMLFFAQGGNYSSQSIVSDFATRGWGVLILWIERIVDGPVIPSTYRSAQLLQLSSRRRKSWSSLMPNDWRPVDRCSYLSDELFLNSVDFASYIRAWAEAFATTTLSTRALTICHISMPRQRCAERRLFVSFLLAQHRTLKVYPAFRLLLVAPLDWTTTAH